MPTREEEEPWIWGDRSGKDDNNNAESRGNEQRLIPGKYRISRK